MTAPGSRSPALRGRWMAAAARRLFSPESFALLVEPAIADLQVDTGRDGSRLVGRGAAVRDVRRGGHGHAFPGSSPSAIGTPMSEPYSVQEPS